MNNFNELMVKWLLQLNISNTSLWYSLDEVANLLLAL